VEPGRQFCLVGRLRHLSANHVLVELFAAKGQLVASLLESVVDPHQVTEQLAFLVQVTAEDTEHHAAENGQDLGPRSTPGIGRVERLGQDPVMIQVLEVLTAADLLSPCVPTSLVRWHWLPTEHMVLGLE
jgi:hypothetical protein